jgi:hypothetical protein
VWYLAQEKVIITYKHNLLISSWKSRCM